MTEKAKRRYSGDLNSPIVLPLHLTFEPPPNERERWKREKERWVLHARAKKLWLLLAHFKIPPTSEHAALNLALALAQEHVPGMRVLSAPRKEDDPSRKEPSRLDLSIAIDTLRYEREAKGKKTSVLNAIRILQTRKPKVWGRYKDTTLRTRYYEFFKGVPMKGTFEEQARALFLGKGPDVLYRNT